MIAVILPLVMLATALVTSTSHAQPVPSGAAAPAESAARAADPALSAALLALKPGQWVSRSEAQAATLQSLYLGNGYQPLWIRDGLPGPSAETVRGALARASLHGLNPEDYRARWLEERLLALAAGSVPAAPAELAQLDIILTLALLRYLADVHDGRAATRQISGVWIQTPSLPDVARLIDTAPDPGRLQKLIDGAAPAYPMYGRLLKARADYATLVAAGREAPKLAPPGAAAPGKVSGAKVDGGEGRIGEVESGKVASGGKVEPGDVWELTPAIAARLIELGDLAAGEPVGQRYEGAVVDAVRRFQGRHGLAVDGVVGKSTLAALQTPNRQRLRQIDLALERLRWLPPLVADRVIGVNIPDFTLRAYAADAGDGGRMKLVLQTRVVVGREGRTPTPVFIANLNTIDFAPYWNVPFSIARGEILPRLRRDPGYLARQDMEFVAADGRTVSHDASPANLAAVASGAMRIRQRPGASNALGNVKFTMPNSMNIYLHDTPSRSLFSQSRRDFSHGCIRVEAPHELARYALADDPAWDEPAIVQAMEGGELRVVKLPRQIPVVVFYTTVTVDEDGTLRFLPDIYGYDRKLDAAMPASP